MIEVFADQQGIEKYTADSGPYVYFLSRLFLWVHIHRLYPGEVFTVYRLTCALKNKENL